LTLRPSLTGTARRRTLRPHASRRASSGQSLVEFALVFPLFFTMALGIIEFAFAFNAILSVNFASRDAALAAAEAANIVGGDCVVLSGIEDDVGAPARASAIDRVDIYRAKSNGTPYSPAADTSFTRTGSTTCTLPDGTSTTVPYTKGIDGYPEADRCNILAGCGGTHTSIDHIGVKITYTHQYVTPLQTFVGTGSGFSFERSNVMRMEPVL
jgi:Flp pilus assembly protein TadG